MSRLLIAMSVCTGLFFVYWALNTEKERRTAVRLVAETRLAVDSTRESMAKQSITLSAIEDHVDSVSIALAEHKGTTAVIQEVRSDIRQLRGDMRGIRLENAALFMTLRRVDSLMADDVRSYLQLPPDSLR